MRHLKTFEHFINENTLTSIILDITAKWKSKNKMTPKQINNGYCMDFAEEVIEKIGIENNNSLHRVYSEYLYDYDDLGFNDDDQIFDDENLYRWNKKSINQYGGLPEIDDIEDYEPDTHVWLFLDGKHYDVENPNGVDAWYKLNFFKRDLKKYK
jgi:hypothetical protein